MKIQVISLKRSVDRREDFSAFNSHLDFEFFDAVDGNEISKKMFRNPIRDRSLFDADLGYSMGAYGCALSHLALWDKAIATGQPVTIAEDDAIFRSDFMQAHAEQIAQLPEDWDIAVWAWNFDSILSLHSMAGISPAVMVFNQEQLRNKVTEFQSHLEKVSLMRLDKCFGTPAYTISPQGAAKFRRLCFPLRKFDLYFPVLNRELPNNGVDIAMNRIYSSTQSFVSFPPLAVTMNEREHSTVQANS